MHVDTALSLVASIVYKPGWSFTATDHTNRFEGAIKLRIEYPAQNSDRSEARLGYPTAITTYATFPIVVEGCDDTAFWRKVVGCVLTIEEHETREFFRVMPTYWAPFHPHNVDGMRRWGTPDTDLLFGIA